MTTGRTVAATEAGPGATGRRWWLVLLGLVMVAQLAILYAPSTPGPPGPTGVDKVVHAAAFAAPTFAALAAGLPRRWVVGLLALHAPVSELVQAGVLPHRDGSLGDVVADLTGVLLGLVLQVVWRRSRR